MINAGPIARGGKSAVATRAFFTSPAVATGAAGTGPEVAAAAPAASNNAGNWIRGVLAAGLVGGGLFSYALFTSKLPQKGSLTPPPFVTSSKPGDYEAVKTAIRSILDVEGYDDGSYGPVLVRLAWHASGSYDAKTNTGGSNGATMRFSPECEFGANAGLQVARELLEPLKKQFPWITYADLWTLAGATAVEEMGGPPVPWRAGREDKPPVPAPCPPDGRLPDAAQGAAHIRDIFYRMGFNDQEIVALSGAHALGRCHTTRSGFDGPWGNSPTTMSNMYFQDLVNRHWQKRTWKGPLQYEDKESKALMMLPTDMALLWDKAFKPWVKLYAKDEERFFKDFASAFSKLMELGVAFPLEAKYI